jgi:hypothetical protein
MKLQGLEFVFQLILEDKEPHNSSWQYIMGRLLVLDHLLGLVPQLFDLGLDQRILLMAVDLSFQNLTSSHSKVAKTSSKVFVSSAKILAVLDATAFNQVWDLTLALEPTLQLGLRKRLKSAIHTLPALILESVQKCVERLHQHHNGYHYNDSLVAFRSRPHPPPLIRSTSNSPSRSSVGGSSRFSSTATVTSVVGSSSKSNITNRVSKRPSPYGKRPSKAGRKKAMIMPSTPEESDANNLGITRPQHHTIIDAAGKEQTPLPIIPSLLYHQSWQQSKRLQKTVRLIYSLIIGNVVALQLLIINYWRGFMCV